MNDKMYVSIVFHVSAVCIVVLCMVCPVEVSVCFGVNKWCPILVFLSELTMLAESVVYSDPRSDKSV